MNFRKGDVVRVKKSGAIVRVAECMKGAPPLYDCEADGDGCRQLRTENELELVARRDSSLRPGEEDSHHGRSV